MQWDDLNQAQYQDLLTRYENKEDLSGIATILNTSISTLERNIRAFRGIMRNNTLTPVKTLESPHFTPSKTPEFKDYVYIEEDSFIVISDIEIPDHDIAMLETAYLLGVKNNIRTLIIAGDLVATDQDALNHWGRTWARDPESPFYDIVQDTNEILIKFAEWFTLIIVINGNHDARVAKATKGQVFLSMLLDRAKWQAKDNDCKIIFSQHSYLYVKTTRGTVYICHQQNFSNTPVKLAQDIYKKTSAPEYDSRDVNSPREKCHIVITHTHLIQSGFSPDGMYECYGIGCCRDPYRTQYAMTSANKHHQWNQGFLMAREGWLYNLSRRATRWDEMLGDYYEGSLIAG